MFCLRSMLILLVGLVLCVSYAVPAEDEPETAYDESESLPCKNTPVVSAAEPQIISEVPTLRPSAFRLRLDTMRRLIASQPDNGKGRADPITDCLIILDRSLRC
jgi:hypothetical protein